eukprot:797275-Ditylum_brightwellii.AAC.1
MAEESGRGKDMVEVYDSLDSLFEDLKQQALPFATQIVQNELGACTRDNDVDAVVLPHRLVPSKLVAIRAFFLL